MTSRETFVKDKSHKIFPEMSMGSHLANRKWPRENLDSSDVNNHLVHFTSSEATI